MLIICLRRTRRQIAAILDVPTFDGLPVRVQAVTDFFSAVSYSLPNLYVQQQCLSFSDERCHPCRDRPAPRPPYPPSLGPPRKPSRADETLTPLIIALNPPTCSLLDWKRNFKLYALRASTKAMRQAGARHSMIAKSYGGAGCEVSRGPTRPWSAMLQPWTQRRSRRKRSNE